VLQPHHVSAILDGITVRQINLGRLRSRYGSKSVTALFSLLAAVEALRLHRDQPFDIIHGHGDAIDACILGLAATVMRIPLIMTIHAGMNPRLRYRLVAPSLFRLVSRFIAVGQHIKVQLQSFGIPGSRVHVISSGVELHFFERSLFAQQETRALLGIPNDVSVAISVGRLHPLKGYSYLVDAIKSLGRAGFHVFIVGDGPERVLLEEQARNLPQVHLVGEQPPAVVAQYLRSADLFVLPSVDLECQAEGTPTSLMEAMAVGLPVVATMAGAIPDLIQDSVGGLLVPQRDAQALADALRWCFDNPSRLREMGQVNAVRIRDRAWPIVAERIDAVYHQAIAECSKQMLTRGVER